MRGNALHLNDTRRCPSCEYDLHGNTSGRCPECGSPILSAASSRLPWLYQKARGGIRAYIQTVALLLFKPRELAAETKQRIQHSPAHRFHHESMALATFIGTGLFAVIFLVRGARWETLLNPSPNSLFGEQKPVLWAPLFALGSHFSISIPIPALAYWAPAFVWTDRLFILVPALPAIYFSLRITAWCYRQFFRVSIVNSPVNRRRAVRLAYYGSGLAPIVVTIVGIGTLLRVATNEEWAWAIGNWSALIWIATVLFALLLPIAFYYPTLTLLARAGRGTILHACTMVLLFPLITVLAFTLTTAFTFWVCGYVLVAIWSMAH